MDGVLIAAVPLGARQIRYKSGDVVPMHQTLVYFGKVNDFNRVLTDDIKMLLEEFCRGLNVITAKVIGRGVLGDEDDNILLTESATLSSFRRRLVGEPVIQEALTTVAQHPEWISHLSIGDTDAYKDTLVVFNKIGFWIGDEHFDFDLGESYKFYE